MTRLQKQQPPASTGKPNAPAPLHTAVPYETLPLTDRQPVLVSSTVKPSTYKELPSTNPFSPHYVPPEHQSDAQSNPFSPVSPLVESPSMTREQQPQIVAPQPQRPDVGQRIPVDLRRLDAKSCSVSQPPEKPVKPVRVAKDMFDGALPPVYKREASQPTSFSSDSAPRSSTHQCGKCGKRRSEGHAMHGNSCTQCGKRKASAPAAISAQSPSVAPGAHGRKPSEGSSSHQSKHSFSTASPVNSPRSPSEKYCTKCGRHKRPTSDATLQSPSARLSPTTAQTGATDHTSARVKSAGLSIQPDMHGIHNPVYPKIDVIPPSASSYRPLNSALSNYGDESPLVGSATKQEFKLFRNSSLARSLSRRLSRKNRTVSAPLPSQQLAADEHPSGEHSAGRLINMISNAMQTPPHDHSAQYSMLDPVSQPDRPTTPFSFVGGKDDQDAFEMVDLRDRSSFSEKNSLEQVREDMPVMPLDDHQTTIPQDTIDVIPRSKSAEPHGQHLSVQDAEQRPQITRFKSLRSGVSRMNSTVSRSTSLKRLGSLKTVHHNWYRNDMAIEGATSDNVIAAF
ncbi:hypothetical protein HRR83_005725 [Exophiala dermatitidis]|uniref:Uncharacterized protein n=1 Tax=Exophiala dermatitidis TaxID=5970 RepID=A0AAN6IV13_EXODE|nr:hypothetical protein HRR73_007300 [Exophiala dermatitidis]KAJ4513281.1 hypothetical protein HRR74_006093 [Exophiala dermatitidis]KAJ4538168.1 hypothetical protein HRR77_007207 [Exophiala dermatitidis]KAJ4539905.1 hypothetical protein HRR76_003334 [Exophiala dermatitidis]KAJ4562460.1 hypothetical protein HRR79_006785 [Exophiala dermatitidis]